MLNHGATRDPIDHRKYRKAGTARGRFAVARLVQQERDRQDAKWGTEFPGRTYSFWLTILTEEVGEFAEAILEAPYEGSEADIREELVQVAAVAMAALEFGGEIRGHGDS